MTRLARAGVRALIVGLMVLTAGRTASAQGTCSVAASASASFGSATSFDVQATARTASAAAVGSCTGGLLNVLVILGETPYFRATIGGSANGFNLSNGAGDLIPYSAAADPTFTFPLTPGVTFNYYQSSLLSLLGLLGGSGANLPMYFRTTTGGNLAAGTYTDTFTINWSWKICNIGAIVCLGYTQGTGTTTVSLTLTVTNACQISSAPNVNFGTAPTAATFVTIDQSIGLLCTKNATTHSVGLSAGQQPSGGRRRLANGANRLEYDLFKGVSTTVWETAGAARVAAPGPANGVTAQLFGYRARVYSDQTTPPTGIYTDTIVIDIVF